MWKLKEPSDENQTECHEIEPNPSKDRAMPEGDNPSFWDEFTKFTSLPKYLATGLLRRLMLYAV
jgi:hypothetical protein